MFMCLNSLDILLNTAPLLTFWVTLLAWHLNKMTDGFIFHLRLLQNELRGLLQVSEELC